MDMDVKKKKKKKTATTTRKKRKNTLSTFNRWHCMVLVPANKQVHANGSITRMIDEKTNRIENQRKIKWTSE